MYPDTCGRFGAATDGSPPSEHEALLCQPATNAMLQRQRMPFFMHKAGSEKMTVDVKEKR